MTAWLLRFSLVALAGLFLAGCETTSGTPAVTLDGGVHRIAREAYVAFDPTRMSDLAAIDRSATVVQRYHFSLGTYFRNTYVYEDRYGIETRFRENGVADLDEMSAYLLLALWYHSRGELYSIYDLLRAYESDPGALLGEPFPPRQSDFSRFE